MSSDIEKQEKLAEEEQVSKPAVADAPENNLNIVEGEPAKDALPVASKSESTLAPESKSDADPANATNANVAQPDDSKDSAKKVKGFIRETVELVVFTLVLLVAIRGILAEARYIPSSSMEPTLQINDRILVEKVSGWTGRPIERGDILVFYPPPIELGGKDISYSPLYVMGRLTGLPCFPIDTAYIKRVVGLPGDMIRVERGVGVFVNDQFLPEPYIKERPDYDLHVLGDIGGHNAVGQLIKPYGDSNEPIIVPTGKLLMMGDNRNNSEDGHVWGFLDQKRVIGKSCLLFWRMLPGQTADMIPTPGVD